MSQLATWQIVPNEYDEICSWLAIDRSEEGAKATHPFVLLYAPDISPIKDEPVKVSLRVYGVVESLSISPTGNYTGRKESAPRAVQFVSLTAGSFPDAFRVQLESIRDIRSYVGTVLGCTVEDSTRKPGTIYIQRMVFTKVRNRGAPMELVRSVRRDAATKPKSAINFGDDPHGWTSEIKNDWVVTHKLSTGVYLEGGRAVKKPYSVIRPGDFVEVVCTVEITKFRKRSGWGTEARLILQEVLRVCDKDVVQIAQPPAPEPEPVNGDEAFVNSLFRLWADADTVDPNAMEG
ncbi:uncharacterized protein TRAVEDRAFT_18354 [Trametes versicolor FP-101664 SS1]|uniref:uncharacterized protein n=1 Tax=Trametes versicolor (strain FP-101664) TaxID=717944 RepID=UPI0004622065|nr:uncharacterized protein TRAVEDRAFT_18354 [Trametes versicolor FP-101664 SS1]EIW61753.1 hypothetical protein TRAVEDRAFT_18354 [Trametes versicolor FP-101664 SS1]